MMVTDTYHTTCKLLNAFYQRSQVIQLIETEKTEPFKDNVLQQPQFLK